MLKKELRLNYKKYRKDISKETSVDSSIAISNNILKLPIWSLDYYHIFLQIKEKKEVDTSFILSVLQGKDKNIVIPKISSDNNLISYVLTDSLLIKKNNWNVPEPVNGLEVPASKIDVVFLPLLAFDLQGNRVGYGKGFYDNFLKQCRADVIKIGLSFFEAENRIADVSVADIPMNYCVTPKRVYEF